MPTARELLEQADALMRRNRLAPAPAPLPASDEGIPTLMDVVPAPPVIHPAAAVSRAAPPSAALPASPAIPTDLEDVPLLTDAVEEIEAPSIFDEPPDADDPDAWTDTLTGAHTIIPDVPLELPQAGGGEVAPGAPIGVLPEEWGAVVAGHAGPELAVETIDIASPRVEEDAQRASADSDAPAPSRVADPFEDPRDALPPPPAAEALPLPADVSAEPAPPERSLVFDDTDFAALPRAEEEASASGPPVAQADETQPATPFEWPSAPLEPSAPPEPLIAQPEPIAAAPLMSAAIMPTPEPAAAADDARWTALAEEVRMQVLQRIDLFTDTGLREQLAARLQPIVDRASADLVATINQHVGVLLRAYVAEAIEREIEHWRADRK